jgi:WD40 repeat protein
MGTVQRPQPKDPKGQHRGARRWTGFAAVLVALAAVLAAAATVVDKQVEQQPHLWWLWVVLVGIGAAATATAGVLMSPWQQGRVEAAEEVAAADRARAERERLRQVELEARLEAAGRGVARADWRGWYFTGRTGALGDLVYWLHGPNASGVARDSQAVGAAGMARVVTGEPGSGKSAVLGRLVTLSDPTRRTHALQAGVEPGTDPGERSLDVVIHAGGKETEQILDLIAEGAGLQLRAESLTSRIEELQAALRDRKSTRPLMVVVDALDEADAPHQLMRDVFRPLASAASDAGIRLLLGVRPRLIPLLGIDPDAVINLDQPPYVDPGGLQRYVRRLLLADGDPTATTPYQDQPSTVVDKVAQAVAVHAGTTFLIAQLAARTLADAETAVNLDEPEWQDRLPTTVGAAMDGYLARFDSDQTRVRDLLLPLAWAHDPGLADQKVWAQLASALGTASYTEHQVRWLVRDSAAVDLLQRTEQADGPAAWRLYHEELGKYLRTLVDLADRDVQQHYTNILRDYVPPLLTDTSRDNSHNWLRADLYTRTHLATHAAAAGQLDRLLTDPGFLLTAHPARLLRALPAASTSSGQQVAGVYQLAVHQLRSRPVEEAAAYLELAARQLRADGLADRIQRLGLVQPWTVRWAAWKPTTAHRTVGRHTDSVTAVAVGSVDGRTVAATTGYDDMVRVWDLGTGASVGKPLVGHTKAIRAVAVGSVDSRTVAVSTGDDHIVRVWDLSTGASVGKPLVGHTESVQAVAIGELNGRPIAVTGGWDQMVRVWDLDMGAVVGEPLSGDSSIFAIAVETLGGRPIAVTGGWDGIVRVWDLQEGVQIRQLFTGQGSVFALAVGELEGQLVAATGGRDGTVRVWELGGGNPIGKLQVDRGVGDLGKRRVGSNQSVFALAMGELNKQLIAVTGHRDGMVRVWDLSTGAALGKPFAGHTASVWAVAVAELDGRLIAVTGSEDNTVRLWDLSPSALATDALVGDVRRPCGVAAGELGGRPVAVTGHFDGTLQLWDLNTGTAVGEPFVGHTGLVCDVAAGKLDGHLVAVTNGSDRTLRVWDLAAGTPVGKPIMGVHAMGIGQLNERLVAVSSGKANALEVWDLGTGTRVGQPLAGYTSPVWKVAMGKLDGRSIAITGHGDGTLRIWDLLEGVLIRQPLVGHADSILAVEVGGLAGRMVAVTGSHDHTVRVWDLQGGVPIGQPLAGHTGSVLAVALLDLNGRLVAVTGGHDQTLWLWDVHSGRGRTLELGAMIHGITYASASRILVATARGIVLLQLMIHDWEQYD